MLKPHWRNLKKTGITDDALARSKAKKESEIYDRMDDVFSKSIMISEWERLLGKSYSVQQELDRYNKVTKEDIVRVFNKYLNGSGQRY